MHIGIVVGETSGDILGADLMVALQRRFPEATFSGIGGPRMLALGFESFFGQDRLAVMGFIDPLKRLPELLRIRKYIRQHFLNTPPDVFIGIDSPDFNLPIERTLKEAGIPTVHYVSPSVWAWRQGRIHGIAKSIDLMLTVLPFEQKIYLEHDIPVAFVGHPLADSFALELDELTALTDESRKELGSAADELLVALLPGSRSGEVKYLTPVFLRAAKLFAKAQKQNVRFIIPAVNESRQQQIADIYQQECEQDASLKELIIDFTLGNSKQVMTAADMVLMASGTTTLEALLLKKPMVVAYKKDAFSAWLTRKLIKTPFISLPNLLAGEALVPEILQEEATAERLAAELQLYIDQPDKVQLLKSKFLGIHSQLKQNAGEVATQAIVDTVGL